MSPIKSGMFIMPYHDAAKPLSQCYDEDMELVIQTEELGFDEFWIGEHHTIKYESVAMPELFIAAAMRETKRIRMGPAPICLNLHHPVQVASRLAFLDHLCKGRLNVCIGPSGTGSDMEIFGADPKQASQMVRESIDMIIKLWTTDPPYELEGEFWQIRLTENLYEDIGFGMMHKPYQQPHPPIFLPGTSPNSSSMKLAGQRGFLPMSHCLVTANVMASMWQAYEQAAVDVGNTPGRSDWRILRAIYLADTTAEAQRIARSNSLGKNFEYIGVLMERSMGGRQIYKRDQSVSDADIDMDYLMTEQIIAGDVDEVLRRLLAMIEETGPFGTLVLMGYDWDDKDRWQHSNELFAHELMPALNKAVGAAIP